MNLTHFCGVPVTTTIPEKWNSTKGTISGPSLRLMSDTDILECADEVDGIISAKHWTRINNETREREPSNTVLLTFNKKKKPTSVYIGLERFTVNEYFPKPLRCFKCQEYGHHQTKCTKPEVCAKCKSEEHKDKDCVVHENDYLCANCDGQHPSWSRSCPKFELESKVCQVKIINDISYFEARKLVFPKRTTKTYAEITKVDTCSTETQTDISFSPHDIVIFTIVSPPKK